MSDIPTKYEVLIEQYLRSIVDISVNLGATIHGRSQVQGY